MKSKNRTLLLSLLLLGSFFMMSMGGQIEAQQKSVKKASASKKTVQTKKTSVPKKTGKKAVTKKPIAMIPTWIRNK